MSIERVRASFAESARNFEKLAEMAPQVLRAAEMVERSLRAGGKAMFCGNGGSAADSQHLAAELLGRYLVNRPALAAVALTTDTSTLTAIGNDFGFEEVFERQVRGLGRAGDVLVGISTSGNSKNVIRALNAARELGVATIGLTGERGGEMGTLCDLCLKVPSNHTPRIQEMHIAVGHMICELVEAAFA